MAKRDARIDLLRTLGLLLIVLAHVEPPENLFQLRTFDVVLMVFVNGLSFRASARQEEPYGHYVLRRFQRLILPTWMFCAPLLIGLTILSLWVDTIVLPLSKYLSTFSLTAGIGYVWIILIYFEMALLSPLLLRALERWGIRRYLLVLVAAAPLYELLSWFLPKGETLPGYIARYLIQDPIGYGFVCALGIALGSMTLLQRDGITLFAGLGWLGLGFARGFPLIQDWKYPPTFYYLAYGITVSLFLCRMAELPQVQALGRWGWVNWLSRNSFWFYFWHMIPVMLLYYHILSLPFWPVQYLFVLVTAILLTLAHNRVKAALVPGRKILTP